jgi:hypothetical protein
MPVLSYIHQLFNAEHCQTYIHTLRWKERPLQCPRCQSQDVDSLGYLSLPPWVQALLVQRLPADFQRSDPYPAPPEQAVVRVLDSGDLPVVSFMFIAAHCPGVGGP